MLNAIIGTKLDQSQEFTIEGRRISVTHILAGPCWVVAVKTKTSDGYDSIQLGIGHKRPTVVAKPLLGHFKKAGLEKNPPRILRETRIYTDSKRINADTEISENLPKVGAIVNVGDVFKPGDTVQVTGISKGKGFAGVVKRHHFKGGPRTHGQSDRERAPGSIGQTTTPGRVYKGKRMAGRMGNEKVTLKNLKVVKLDPEKNLLTVSGLVPGGRNSLLVIKKILYAKKN